MRIPWIVIVALIMARPAGQTLSETRADQEAFLRNASLVSAPDPAGRRPSWRGTFDDGTLRHDAGVLVAGNDANGRDYRLHIAAYELDKLVALDLVATTVERTVDGTVAAVTWWIDNVAMSEVVRRAKKIDPPDALRWNRQMASVRVFDELTANRYRDVSPAAYSSTVWDNLIITKDWNIWLIDHTRTFSASTELAHPDSLTRCERVVLGRLRALTRETLTQTLAQYLADDQLDALDIRRQLIIKQFDQLIASRGEAAVVFDRQ